MTLFLRCLEAFLLTGTGVFMAVFSRSDEYWRLINPKYAWLTLTAGLLITVLGVGGFFRSERKPRISELLALAVFLGLAILATSSADPFSGTPKTQNAATGATVNQGSGTISKKYAGGSFAGGSLTLHYDEESGTPADINIDGASYTRMNLAELLAGEEGGWTLNGGLYAVQGTVIRTEELDAKGYIAVGRLYIFCCFADAIAVTALVRVDHPEAYHAGEWVRVLGRIQEEKPFPEFNLRVKGALSSINSEKYVIAGVSVTPSPVEGVPFILDIKKENPFSY